MNADDTLTSEAAARAAYRAIEQHAVPALRASLASCGPNALGPNGDTLLIEAVRHDALLCARALLKAGAHTQPVNWLGDTALHLAAKHGSADMVQLLIDHGAELNAVGQEGFTAINDAMQFGQHTIAQALAQAGAALDDADTLFGLSARERAAQARLVLKATPPSRP